MSADHDLRFSETLVRHLHAARRKLVPYSVIEMAGLRKLERLEREGHLSAPEAMHIAKRVFGIAENAGEREIGDAANELHIEAVALWENDRSKERRARAKADEEYAAFQADLDDRLQREAEERRRAAEERWAALDYCTTDEFEARVGRRPLRPILKDRGYLDGGVGSWKPTARAIEERVAKVEVRSRYSVILWSKTFVEVLQSEFRSSGVPS